MFEIIDEKLQKSLKIIKIERAKDTSFQYETQYPQKHAKLSERALRRKNHHGVD
jgi:hypothetical protein